MAAEFANTINEATNNKPFQCMIMFGDSYLDNGSFADVVMCAFDEDWLPPQFDGRNTNGPSLADLIEDEHHAPTRVSRWALFSAS